MLIVDIVLALVLLALAYNGWKAGLIKSLGHLVGAVLGFLIARAWSSLIAVWMARLIPLRQGVLQFIAFILLFLIVERIVGILVELADKAFKIVSWLPIISSVQKMIGAFIGLIEAVVLIGASAYVITTSRLDPTLLTWVNGSRIAGFCVRWFRLVMEFLT